MNTEKPNQSTPTLAPAMFISHGSPMFALEPGKAGQLLNQYSKAFDHCSAILVVSAHWITQGLSITASDPPAIHYDFGGFPKALYQLSYPVSGAPDIASSIQNTLAVENYPATLNDKMGLDHGAWVPLLHLRPQADIPVIQLSLDSNLNTHELIHLGQALAPLRTQGIAIIGSGSLTHNFSHFGNTDSPPAHYVIEFQQWIRNKIRSRSLSDLANAHTENPWFYDAHPTNEHYLPLLIALGASTINDSFNVIEGGILHRALSMESYIWQ